MNREAEEPIVFSCKGSALVGVLHRPRAAQRGVAVLIVVGGPQYRVGSHRQFVSSARALSDAGYPVLRFDYRGMGDSEGAYAGFEDVGDDLRAAIDALCMSCTPRQGVVLLGLCDAASAALMYARSDARVAGMILMNPWVRTEQSQAAVVVRRYYTARLLQRDFWRKLLGGGFDFAGSISSLLGNLARATGTTSARTPVDFIGAMRSGLQQFEGPVLIIQSGRDLTADEFRALCRSDEAWQRALARSSVESVEMTQADHTFSGPRDLDEFHGHCGRWLSRQFGDAACR